MLFVNLKGYINTTQKITAIKSDWRLGNRRDDPWSNSEICNK